MSAGRWPVWRIAVLLYPLAAGAVAINLFFLMLMARAVGLSAITPVQAAWGGVALGPFAAWWFARRMRRLMDEAAD